MQPSKLFISSLEIKSVPFIADQKPSLDSNEVLLYSIYLPDFMHLKTDLSLFLNASELERAERFHKEIDKNRFIVYRSILKLILAVHSKLEIENIFFDYKIIKKPFLAARPELHFNISHSEDFALIAISNKEVGIDIEFLAKDFGFANLFSDIFEDNEITLIENSTDKKRTFYTLWTRKEAFVKALGKGIDEDFKQIPAVDGEHFLDAVNLKNEKNWQLYSFDLGDQYLAATAFESSSKNSNLVLYAVPNTMKTLLQMTHF